MTSYFGNATSLKQLKDTDLSDAQMALQAWTATSQAMSAKQQVQQSTNKSASDPQTSEVQMIQQASQQLVSNLSNPLIQTLTNVANITSQGII